MVGLADRSRILGEIGAVLVGVEGRHRPIVGVVAIVQSMAVPVGVGISRAVAIG